jgi:1,4-dihydroxy-6-naphthoate synthase
MARHITIGCSPDTDDLFMMYGLVTDQIDTQGLTLDIIPHDIEELNHWAGEARLDVTAISAHAFAYTKNRYCILPHGASMGENYGPVIVTRRPYSVDELRHLDIAIPGTLTSAFLMLRLLLGDVVYHQARFNTILDEVASGRAGAGLIIHEGQLIFQQQGLHLAVDLGKWWHDQTDGLPFPLSITVIRTDIEPVLAKRVSELIKQSILFSLAHRQEALAYALDKDPCLDLVKANAYIDRYVNERTIDMGPDGRRAIATFLSSGYEKGLLPEAVTPVFFD